LGGPVPGRFARLTLATRITPSSTLILVIEEGKVLVVTEDSNRPEHAPPHDNSGLSTTPFPSTERDYPQEPQVHPQAEDGVVSRETTSPESVSRETTSWQVRTAAQVAEGVTAFDDDTTPLARAAEQSVLARNGTLHRDRPAPRPEGTRVFVVANQKGGVGKTTTTVNVAAALAQLGQRVLVIDLDPQGNASTALSVPHHRGVPSTYDMLVDGQPLADVMTKSDEIAGLWVVPATIDLAGAEIELVSMVARETRLQTALAGHPWIGSAAEAGDERFDYVLIDCPPSLGLLTLNALVAGREMFIPIQAEYYALEGLGQLLETVDMVRKHLNQNLVVTTILLTMYDARTRLAAGVASEVREHFGPEVLKTAIPRSVRVSEAPSYGQTVMTYDPASAGALSYLEAAREIATKGAPR
jgi:chromosome partitioning protein